jgi:hypothetical protein
MSVDSTLSTLLAITARYIFHELFIIPKFKRILYIYIYVCVGKKTWKKFTLKRMANIWVPEILGTTTSFYREAENEEKKIYASPFFL